MLQGRGDFFFLSAACSCTWLRPSAEAYWEPYAIGRYSRGRLVTLRLLFLFLFIDTDLWIYYYYYDNYCCCCFYHHHHHYHHHYHHHHYNIPEDPPVATYGRGKGCGERGVDCWIVAKTAASLTRCPVAVCGDPRGRPPLLHLCYFLSS